MMNIFLNIFFSELILWKNSLKLISYILLRFLSETKRIFFVPDAADIKKLIHLNECIIGGTFFGKRKIFAELQGFRNVYSHDSDFIRRASAKGNYIISKFDELTYKYYRNNPESIINKMLEHYYDGR